MKEQIAQRLAEAEAEVVRVRDLHARALRSVQNAAVQLVRLKGRITVLKELVEQED